MNWKSFFDNPEEFFVGGCLQFPLIFVVGWWVLPIMALCSPLWRLGGWEDGNKLYRRVGVTLVVCVATFIAVHHWQIFLAMPFMVWLNPMSYGKDSWLYKWLKSDIHVRVIGYAWYWSAFLIAAIF